MTILPPPPLRRCRRTGTPSASSRPRRSATSSGALRRDVAGRCARPSARGRPCQPILDSALSFTDIEAAGDYQGRQGLLVRRQREHQQRPCVARGQPGVGDGLLDRRWEIEEADGIGDAGAAAPQAKCDRLVRQAEGVGEPRVCGRLLHGVEIGPQQVLGERHLELVAAGLRGRPDDRGDARDTGNLSGSQASLARHKDVPVTLALDHDRMEQAVQAD